VSDLKALYQSLIIEHGKHPRREGPLDLATHEARRTNPLCGDRVTLRLRIEDGVVRAVAFEAKGCLLAKASASILGDLVDGRTADEALALATTVHAIAHDADPPGDVGPLQVLRPVRDFAARIACIELAWTCLEDALHDGAASGPNAQPPGEALHRR
jgi:nitrogen fixation NifU-like protein